MCNLGEGLIEKYTALGVAQGAEQERINTERERKRADEAERRADEAEVENARLREEIARLKAKEVQSALDEAKRIAHDPNIKGYTDMDELFADLEK